MEGVTPEIEAGVRRVLAAILGVAPGDLTPDTAAENVPGWDSMKQINLILALEDEFDVEFSDREVAGLTSFRRLCEAVRERRADVAR